MFVGGQCDGWPLSRRRAVAARRFSCPCGALLLVVACKQRDPLSRLCRSWVVVPTSGMLSVLVHLVTCDSSLVRCSGERCSVVFAFPACVLSLVYACAQWHLALVRATGHSSIAGS